MICVEIEKEIQQENKIILNLNLRQVICLCIAVFLSVVGSVFLRLDFSVALYPCMAIGGCCFVFGWGKWDGLPMEKILAKKIESAVFQNSGRVYRTKNRYISLMNGVYDKMRAADCKDRAIVRQIRRECRERRRRRKKSRLRAIQ